MIRRSLATEQGSTLTHQPALIAFTAASTLPIAEVEHQLLEQGALVVRTAVLAEKTLRALLALGLIVLVEADIPAPTLAALAGFTLLDAGHFNSTDALLAHEALRPKGLPQA